MPIPPGFKEIDIAGFAEANGPWFEKLEGGRLIRGFMPDPSIFRDMDKAAARLADAVQAGEGIAIFGDYDVDGVTSTVILRRVLELLGVPFDPAVLAPEANKRATTSVAPVKAANKVAVSPNLFLREMSAKLASNSATEVCAICHA